MGSVGAYLLSVSAAALLCGLVRYFLGKKGTSAAVGNMVAGIFLLVTIISPLTGLDNLKLENITDRWQAEAADAAALGSNEAKKAQDAIIKQQLEAYILDKATEYHADLQVDITLSKTGNAVPVAVSLQGAVAPYAKQQLQQMIEQDLGISKENQQWT